MNYEADDIWIQWSVAAKLQILMKPSPTPPMGQYFIQHPRPAGVATPSSSLTPSNNMMLANPDATQTKEELSKTSSSIMTSPNLIPNTLGSNPRSEATPELFTFAKLDERNKKNGTGFESSTWGPSVYEASLPKAEEKGNKLKVW